LTHEKTEKITLRERSMALKEPIAILKGDKSSSALSSAVNFEEKLESQVMQSIPKEAQITIVRCESANIALYTKNPSFALTDLTLHLSALSKSMKKRFIIRTDPSIRLSEDDARNAINKILPKEILITVLFCDEATGEVILELNNPEGITSEIFLQIAKETGWIAHTRRSPHIPSNSIKNIHSILKNSSKERITFYQSLGKRIFRPPLLSNSLLYNGVTNDDRRLTPNNHNSRYLSRKSVDDGATYQYSNLKEVAIYCLGGVKQVGRSCFVVVTPESKIMLDCGINPGERG